MKRHQTKNIQKSDLKKAYFSNLTELRQARESHLKPSAQLKFSK